MFFGLGNGSRGRALEVAEPVRELDHHGSDVGHREQHRDKGGGVGLGVGDERSRSRCCRRRRKAADTTSRQAPDWGARGRARGLSRGKPAHCTEIGHARDRGHERDDPVRDADLSQRAGRRYAAAQRLVQDRGGDGLGVAREELGDGPRDVGAVLQQGLRGRGRGARLAPVRDLGDGPGLADEGRAEDGVRGLQHFFFNDDENQVSGAE